MAFDLIVEPWVPCQSLGRNRGQAFVAEYRELGLRDALVHAHELRDLAGESPLVTAGLYRLLLAVLHRVFGPRDVSEWSALWAAGQWDTSRLDAYFARWQDRFDLFDDRWPFYQAPAMSGAPSPATVLVPEWATGNNAVLFDHHHDAEGADLSPAQCARFLVGLQATVIGGGNSAYGYVTDAPWARGLVALLEGRTLFESLCLNLLPYGEVEMPVAGDLDRDAPAWEQGDPLVERSRPRGYLDYLTWPARRIWLQPRRVGDQVVVSQVRRAQGLRLGEETLLHDPAKFYRLAADGRWRFVRLMQGRVVWRSIAPYLVMASGEASGETRRAPAALAWMRRLVDAGQLHPEYPLGLLLVGNATHPKRASLLEFFRMESWPLPLPYLYDPPLVGALASCVRLVEGVSAQLYGVAGTAARAWVSSPAGSAMLRDADREHARLAEGLGSRFWGSLDPAFRALLVTLPRDVAVGRAAWREAVRSAAWSSVRDGMGTWGDDGRGLRAWAESRGHAGAALAKALREDVGAGEEIR